MTAYVPRHIRLATAALGEPGEQVARLVVTCLRCGASSDPISNNATLARDEMDSFIGEHEGCAVSAA